MPDGQCHPLCHGPARNQPLGRRAARQQRLHTVGVCRTAQAAGARRTGRPGQGNITGLFTVLVEGDDHNEPVSDTVRGILDGHIVLDRAIAERGRYPAMNVLKSVSRTMPACNTPEQNDLIRRCRRILAVYEDMSELIRLGAYRQGSNAEVDEAIRLYPRIEAVLQQGIHDAATLEHTYAALQEALEESSGEGSSGDSPGTRDPVT